MTAVVRHPLISHLTLTVPAAELDRWTASGWLRSTPTKTLERWTGGPVFPHTHKEK